MATTTATDRYRIVQNILAQKGIDADLYTELARAEAMIHNIEQGKMIPPPLPPELNAAQTSPQTTGAPIISQPDQSTTSIPPMQNG